ncbi:uncharacterized protein LOC136086098 [Hydra vulgaris]|uniref:Uncharacterized protein LOC136086098 n=1 Tax=Hydra vulgaris TaxID=6087 RepID=A0ABM4CRE4_HYDVU
MSSIANPKPEGLDLERVKLLLKQHCSKESELICKREFQKRIEKIEEELTFAFGDINKVKYVKVGTRNEYTIKCTKENCKTQTTRLRKHLVSKHKVKDEEAKQLASYYVRYYNHITKIVKNKPWSLLCSSCNEFHNRLDIHLTKQHEYIRGSDDIKEIIKFSKENTITFINKLGADAHTKTKIKPKIPQSRPLSILPSINEDDEDNEIEDEVILPKQLNDPVVNPVDTPNKKFAKRGTHDSNLGISKGVAVLQHANELTAFDKKNFKIANSSFKYFYQSGMNAILDFKRYLKFSRHYNDKGVSNHLSNVLYIWEKIDPKLKSVPKCLLADANLLEDFYASPSIEVIKEQQSLPMSCQSSHIQPRTLISKLSSIILYLDFLKARTCYAGLNIDDIEFVKAKIKEINNSVTVFNKKRD